MFETKSARFRQHGLACDEDTVFSAAMAWVLEREKREAVRQLRVIELRREEMQRDLERRRRQGLARVDEEAGKDKDGKLDERLKPKVKRSKLCSQTG